MSRIAAFPLLVAVVIALGASGAAGCGRAANPSGPSAPHAAEVEHDQDDPQAQPDCAPHCFSGTWRNAPIRVVMYEAAQCSATPVFISTEISALVTVEYYNSGCHAALETIVQAAGLQSRRIAVTRVLGENRYNHEAIVITRPGSTSREIIGAWESPYRTGVVRDGYGHHASDQPEESVYERWSRWADPNASYTWITPANAADKP